MLTIHPTESPRAHLRACGFPSGQNGAKKISNACLNASGFLKNFCWILSQKPLNPRGQAANPHCHRERTVSPLLCTATEGRGADLFEPQTRRCNLLQRCRV